MLKERGKDLFDMLPDNIKEVLIANKGIFAGSAMIPKHEINDIDVFFYNSRDYGKTVDILKQVYKYFETPNCVTINTNYVKVQLCKYNYPTMEQLVESFDFAHVQIAYDIFTQEVTYTEQAKESFISRTTTFTGSEYPLSSLIRLNKYYERGRIQGRGLIGEVLLIFKAILERGFKDYEDFKDQLNAVDLNFFDAEVMKNDLADAEVMKNNLAYKLYQVCLERGLVDNGGL